MLILGINAYHGDASAALLVDGQLVAAAEEERFNRVKHSAGFPRRAIEYCLEAVGARIEDLDHIAIGRNPHAHFADKILYSLKKRPSVPFWSCPGLVDTYPLREEGGHHAQDPSTVFR